MLNTVGVVVFRRKISKTSEKYRETDLSSSHKSTKLEFFQKVAFSFRDTRLSIAIRFLNEGAIGTKSKDLCCCFCSGNGSLHTTWCKSRPQKNKNRCKAAVSKISYRLTQSRLDGRLTCSKHRPRKITSSFYFSAAKLHVITGALIVTNLRKYAFALSSSRASETPGRRK